MLRCVPLRIFTILEYINISNTSLKSEIDKRFAIAKVLSKWGRLQMQGLQNVVAADDADDFFVFVYYRDGVDAMMVAKRHNNFAVR